MKNKIVILLLFFAVAIAFLAGLFASGSPDGLEKVAENLNFDSKAMSTPGMFRDYSIPFIGHPSFSSIIAGLFGIILIVFIFRSVANLHHIRNMIARLLRLERKYEK